MGIIPKAGTGKLLTVAALRGMGKRHAPKHGMGAAIRGHAMAVAAFVYVWARRDRPAWPRSLYGFRRINRDLA